MPLDPSISLGVKTVEMPNMLAQYGQLAQIQSAQQQNQLHQMQMDEYARARQEEEGVRSYLRGADLNAPTTQSGLLQFGKTGLEYAKQLQAQQTAALQQKSAQLKYNADLAEQAGRIYLGVKDQASWDAARPKLAALGGDPSKLPEAYDPNYVASELNQARSVKDQWDSVQPQIEQIKVGNKILFVDKNTRSPTFGKEMMPSQAMSATPGELLAHQDRQRRLEQEMAMGALSPESVDFAAQMYYQTGTMPPFGFGRNAAQARDQVIKRAAQIATGAGTESPVSAEEAAAKVVGNKQTVAAQSTALKSFNTGVEGRAIRSFNTAIDHLDTMGQLADALQNGDVKRINQIGQAFASETGSSAPTNFDAAKSIVGGEVAKALTGSNMALKDREEIRDSINRANSPAQLKGVVTTLQKLMGGQLSSLQTQYISSTGRKDFDTKLSKRSKEVVQTLSGNASAPAAAANVVVTPDGMTHTFPNAQAAANFKKAAGL